MPTYYHHDQLGSTRMLTNSSGEAKGTFSYAPYGALAGSSGEQTTPLGYAGQYTDPVSGLQYLRARYYDPATGQFVNRDPLSPVSRSPYGYVADDPINGTDPTGLLTIGVCVSGSAFPGGIFGFVGSVCAQGSTSGDIGVTATGGPVAGAGSPNISAGPGLEVSNADHISQLSGPFFHAGGAAANGLGGFAQGFTGSDDCGNQISGLLAGPAFGEGVGGEAGATDTLQGSFNLPAALRAVGSLLNPF